MNVQSKINALWDGASGEYDTRPSHGFHNDEHVAAWKRALLSMLPAPPVEMLDVGTGTGALALMLADLGYRVMGVDLSEGMLAQARRKAAEGSAVVRFEIADAIDPPGEASSYDAVISRHVLWTMTDPPRALANWFRLLRPGATLAIIDGLWGIGPNDRLGDIAQSLPLLEPSVSVEEICALVEGAGFAGVAMSDLVEIDRLEHALEDPDETHQPHYVIMATKPA